MRLNLLVEGNVDEAVAKRLIASTGHEIGSVFGKKGWPYIRDRVKAFDRSCVEGGLLTLVDFMDTRLDCPPGVLRAWLPQQSATHIFRVVVREIEAWVMADRQNAADFLKVPVSKLPHAPEMEVDPKQTFINVARASRSSSIRSTLVPIAGKSASEGPPYTSEVVQFVLTSWDPAAAAHCSPSLNRTLQRLQELHQR